MKEKCVPGVPKRKTRSNTVAEADVNNKDDEDNEDDEDGEDDDDYDGGGRRWAA